MKIDDKRLARGRRFFEYHCYEGEDSADAELWHHTHQLIMILNKLTQGVEEKEVGKMYRVRFKDGFEYDACNDELLKSPIEYYRPDYNKGVENGLLSGTDTYH